MQVGTVCNREVVVVSRETSVTDIACIMRERHVGDVLVVDDVEGRRVPVGIVTDRDLVVELLATSLDPSLVSAGDLIGADIVTVEQSTSVIATVKFMRDRGVRRVPVLDSGGSLVGIFTLDDALELLSEQLQDVIGLIDRQMLQERTQRRPASAA